LDLGGKGDLTMKNRLAARLMAGLAAAMLAGCATDIGPSPAELKARWEAENIYPQNYRQDLLAFLRTYLNDPTQVRAAAVSQPQLRYIGPGERYVSCVRFNARNSDGKYVGSKDGAATFVAAKLERFFDNPKELRERELCKDAAFAPFPELERLTR
jgi:hypothetical protein